jgi:hypothetical protein
VRGTVVLVLTQKEKTLAVKRMKRVSYGDFLSQNSDTMNYLPTPEVSEQLRSIA